MSYLRFEVGDIVILKNSPEYKIRPHVIGRVAVVKSIPCAGNICYTVILDDITYNTIESTLHPTTFPARHDRDRIITWGECYWKPKEVGK